MKLLVDFIVELIVALWRRLFRRRLESLAKAEYETEAEFDREAPTLPSPSGHHRQPQPTLHEYCTHCGDQVRLIGAHMLQCPSCGRYWSTDYPPSSERA